MKIILTKLAADTFNKIVMATISTIIGAASACAQSSDAPPTASPGRPLPPLPPMVTMDQKLAVSNHVFIGAGKRIYFINRFYKEVPFEAANSSSPNSTTRHALLEVEIDRNLYPQRSNSHEEIARFFVISSIVPFGSAPSGQDELSAKYVGKPMIYFTETKLQKIRDYAQELPVIVGEILLHNLVVTPAMRGPVENPLPLSEIHEVMRAINRRIESEARSTKF